MLSITWSQAKKRREEKAIEENIDWLHISIKVTKLVTSLYQKETKFL